MLLATRCDTGAATDALLLRVAYGDAVQPRPRLPVFASVLVPLAVMAFISERLFEGFRRRRCFSQALVRGEEGPRASAAPSRCRAVRWSPARATPTGSTATGATARCTSSRWTRRGGPSRPSSRGAGHASRARRPSTRRCTAGPAGGGLYIGSSSAGSLRHGGGPGPRSTCVERDR